MKLFLDTANVGEIRQAGYDVFLVLEATIGFNKREEGAEDDVHGYGKIVSEWSRVRTSVLPS